jgi:hypothetical protein
MDDVFRLGEKAGQNLTEFVQAVEDGQFGLRGSRQHLLNVDAIGSPVGHSEIGEGPTDVDANAVSSVHTVLASVQLH